MKNIKDEAREQSDKEIFRLHRYAASQYRQATDEIKEPLTKFMRRHEKKRRRWLDDLRDGQITKSEFRKRRIADLTEDEEFIILLDDCAEPAKRATQGLWEAILDTVPAIYAENFNYGLFRAERAAGISFPIALLTAEIVSRMWKKNPGMIKMPGTASKLAQKKTAGSDKAKRKETNWQKELLRSAIMFTADVPYPVTVIVEQILDWIRRRNVSEGKSYVTTAVNGAENKGRFDAFSEAAKNDTKGGDPLMRGWVAIMDERTRTQHRKLDGTWVGMDEPWKIDGYEIWFPGDPGVPAYLYRGCRCSIEIRRKSEAHGSVHENERFDGQSYEEWKAGYPHVK